MQQRFFIVAYKAANGVFKTCRSLARNRLGQVMSYRDPIEARAVVASLNARAPSGVWYDTIEALEHAS